MIEATTACGITNFTCGTKADASGACFFLVGGGGGGGRLFDVVAVVAVEGRGGSFGGLAGFGFRGGASLGGGLEGTGCEMISIESSIFMLSLLPPSDRDTEWNDEVEDAGICRDGRIGG